MITTEEETRTTETDEAQISVVPSAEKNKFTIIDNSTILNALSLKAKGLLVLMISLPKDWRFSIKGLVKILPDGEFAVRSALNELFKEGFLKRYANRDGQGKITSWQYVVFENPSDQSTTISPECGFPQLDNPQLGFPQLGNHAQLNTKEQNTKEQNTKERESAHARRFSAPSAEEVKEFMSTLCDGKIAGTESGLFTDYYEANGWRVGRTPMKDWKAAARNWIRRAAQLSPPKGGANRESTAVMNTPEWKNRHSIKEGDDMSEINRKLNSMNPEDI